MRLGSRPEPSRADVKTGIVSGDSSSLEPGPIQERGLVRGYDSSCMPSSLYTPLAEEVGHHLRVH